MLKTFQINTLHRSKYMLTLITMIIVMVIVLSKIPVQEIYKIIIGLILLPGILFLAIRIANNPSKWSFDEQNIYFDSKNKKTVIPISEIKYIRNLPRSGGNLIIIFYQKKQVFRAWRNKIFMAEDDLKDFVNEIQLRQIEYYNL